MWFSTASGSNPSSTWSIRSHQHRPVDRLPLPITSSVYMLLHGQHLVPPMGSEAARSLWWDTLVWYLSTAEGFPIFISCCQEGPDLGRQDWKILVMEQMAAVHFTEYSALFSNQVKQWSPRLWMSVLLASIAWLFWLPGTQQRWGTVFLTAKNVTYGIYLKTHHRHSTLPLRSGLIFFTQAHLPFAGPPGLQHGVRWSGEPGLRVECIPGECHLHFQISASFVSFKGASLSLCILLLAFSVPLTRNESGWGEGWWDLGHRLFVASTDVALSL